MMSFDLFVLILANNYIFASLDEAWIYAILTTIVGLDPLFYLPHHPRLELTVENFSMTLSTF